MASLTNALQELRQERRQAQLHVEKLDRAISVIESLNGVVKTQETNQPKRIISAASRRKMAQAQRARWMKVRSESAPASGAAKATGPSIVKRTMSASAKKKIAAAQKARWAKLRAGKNKAA